MSSKKLDQLVQQMENYLECWKQFNTFMTLSRAKKFSAEDETQFLEVKSLLVQELELILASVEVTSPSRAEIHELVGSAPSLRYLSEINEGNLRNMESQWHKIYIGWHAILGQLKVRQRDDEGKGGFISIFGGKKASSPAHPQEERENDDIGVIDGEIEDDGGGRCQHYCEKERDQNQGRHEKFPQGDEKHYDDGSQRQQRGEAKRG